MTDATGKFLTWAEGAAGERGYYLSKYSPAVRGEVVKVLDRWCGEYAPRFLEALRQVALKTYSTEYSAPPPDVAMLYRIKGEAIRLWRAMEPPRADRLIEQLPEAMSAEERAAWVKRFTKDMQDYRKVMADLVSRKRVVK